MCHEPFTWLRKQLLPLLTMSQFFSLPLSHNYFFKNENKSFEFVDYVALCFTTSGEVKSLGCIFPPTLTVNIILSTRSGEMLYFQLRLHTKQQQAYLSHLQIGGGACQIFMLKPN